MLVLFILGYLFLLILLILLVILLAVLLIPFKYYFHGEKFESAWFNASVSWLFGGLKINLNYSSNKLTHTMRILGIKKKIEGKGKEENKQSIKNEREEKKAKSKSPYSYFNRDVAEKGLQCILKLLNHCKPVRFELKARAGFDDPMYTGLACAVQGAGFAILDKFNIHFQPDFEDEGLKGNLIIRGRIQLFYLLLVSIEFVLAKPFRSIFFKNLKIKIKRRLGAWRILILKKT
jgi:hypothetical protein